MKKRAFALVLVLCLFLCAFSLSAWADNRNTIVHRTETGKKYHMAGCQYLRQSDYEITLEEAVKRGLSACSKCHPPAPDFDVSATPIPATGGWSSSYSASVSTPRPTVKPTATPRPSPMQTPSVKSSSSNFPRYVLAGGGITLMLLLRALVKTIRQDKKRQEEESRLALEKLREMEEKEKAERQKREEERKKREDAQRRIAEEWRKSKVDRREKQEEVQRARREKWLEKQRELTELYGGRTTLECAGAPSYCSVGPDGLPRGFGSAEQWGVNYTFYKTPSGSAYHTKRCRYAQDYRIIPINAFEVRRHGLHPCSCCSPKLPDMSWYERYRMIKSQREKYDVPEPK